MSEVSGGRFSCELGELPPRGTAKYLFGPVWVSGNILIKRQARTFTHGRRSNGSSSEPNRLFERRICNSSAFDAVHHGGDSGSLDILDSADSLFPYGLDAADSASKGIEPLGLGLDGASLIRVGMLLDHVQNGSFLLRLDGGLGDHPVEHLPTTSHPVSWLAVLVVEVGHLRYRCAR